MCQEQDTRISASGRGEVTWARFTWNNYKKTPDKIYEMMVFKTLNIGPWNNFWNVEHKWGESCDCPSLLLWEYRLQHRERNTCGAQWTLQVEEREPRWLEFTELSSGEEKTTERKNSGDLQRVPLEYSSEDWSVHARGQYLRPGRHSLKGLEGTAPGVHTGPVIMRVPTSQIEKPHNSCEIG